MDQPTEHVIHNRLDLAEALRSRKEQLGLSNAFVEAQLQMTDGGCDKVLGPTQAKGMSILVMLDMIELFGARLVIQVNAETEARMRQRWERREERNVRPQKRLSRKLMGWRSDSSTSGVRSSGTMPERRSFPGSTIKCRPRCSDFSMATAPRGCEGCLGFGGCISISILGAPSNDPYMRAITLRLLRGESVELSLDPQTEPKNLHSIEATRTRRATALLTRGRELRERPL
jgi:hypothetical protein